MSAAGLLPRPPYDPERQGRSRRDCPLSDNAYDVRAFAGTNTILPSRSACDSCRLRRVKCDKADMHGGPCSECIKKTITFVWLLHTHSRSEAKCVALTGACLRQLHRYLRQEQAENRPRRQAYLAGKVSLNPVTRRLETCPDGPYTAGKCTAKVSTTTAIRFPITRKAANPTSPSRHQ